ncbi:hypothetical protein BgiMline_004547, partial [Biomphalaria glabrata]
MTSSIFPLPNMKGQSHVTLRFCFLIKLSATIYDEVTMVTWRETTRSETKQSHRESVFLGE